MALGAVKIVCISRKDVLTKPTASQIAQNNAALESLGSRAECKK